MFAMTPNTIGLDACGLSSRFHLPAVNKEDEPMSRLNALVLRRTDDNSKDILVVSVAMFVVLIGVLALF